MTEARVLVVEDNRADARLLQELLDEVPERPFVLTFAASLAEALPIAATHDVVLLDLSLPDGYGPETVERMVAVARSLPIVVLTGTDDERVATEAVKAGAQDYLLKAEITPALVARSVRYAIERKRVEIAEAERAALAQTASRARFVASVVTEATRSLDTRAVLAGVAHAVLPTLGDFCAIDVVRGEGACERVAFAAALPELEEVARPILRYAPGAANPRAPAVEAVARCETICRDDFDFGAIAPDDDYRALAARLGLGSVLVTPLVARGRVLGAISYVMGPSGRRYCEDERILAEEVACHVALALDNAQLFDEAQRAIRARDELMAIVSHDLRGPLGVVALSVSMLETSSEAQRPQFVARAKRGVGRMQRIVEDLLDVARIESGTLDVKLGAVDLETMLDDAYELHRPLAAQKSITLFREYARPLCRVVADRDRIAQVLSNLLGNAVKFTPPGGTIRLVAEIHDELASVVVRDSGPGISAEALPHIFDRFWQASRRRDGLGLGLAIAKGIVHAHGGSIQVTSSLGSGASFGFTLRRSDGSASAEPCPRARGEAGDGAGGPTRAFA